MIINIAGNLADMIRVYNQRNRRIDIYSGVYELSISVSGKIYHLYCGAKGRSLYESEDGIDIKYKKYNSGDRKTQYILRDIIRRKYKYFEILEQLDQLHILRGRLQDLYRDMDLAL